MKIRRMLWPQRRVPPRLDYALAAILVIAALPLLAVESEFWRWVVGGTLFVCWFGALRFVSRRERQRMESKLE